MLTSYLLQTEVIQQIEISVLILLVLTFHFLYNPFELDHVLL